MADEKLIFPIGFDLEEGVKEASKEWKSTYQKQLQKAIDDKPLKVKIDFESKGIDTKEFKQWMALSREAEKLERERIKNAKEWQKVADQTAMAETRRANATNESNARIERQNRKAEASERRKADAVERTNSAFKTQSTYLSRLMQRMVAYASVAQAMSFLRSIRETTAEFELQRVALGALIQDAQKAEMIFEQIKVAAVKSPYEVKDLVTYTKQLAAYGVKADDLMGTMNQLADISAGLGTDMDRIILAYGQIQAAGVLKGTELRQLTELGLPMVELLADYYSTLRNEVVTTSEVFDMISNKEIPFEAVQDILKDLTSEGGRFFDMQSKQAETLQGQWSNMKDTLSIMFDEIGRSEEVQALMRGLIDATKSLAENWRVIWQTVKVVGLTYAGLKSASVITRLLGTTTMTAEKAQKKYARAVEQANIAMGNNGRLATLMAKRSVVVAKMQLNAANATNILSRSYYKLGAIIMANPVGAIMTLVSVLGFFITKNKMAKATAETFAEEQSRLASDMAVNIESSIKSFRRLANEVVKFENGSANQQAALRKLKDQFGDMLPEYQLTAEYLSDISREANNSADAFNKLEASIRGQQTAALQLKLLEREQERIQEMYNEVYNKASGGGFQFVKEFGEMTRRVEAGEWFEDVYKDWRDTFNNIYGDVTDLTKLFAENSTKFEYISAYFYKKGTKSYNWKDLRNLYNQGYLNWEQYKGFVKNLIGNERYANISAMYDLLKAMGTYQENVDKIIKDTENLDPAFSNVTKVVSRAQESFKKLEEIGGDSAKNIREAYDEQMLEIQKQALTGLFDEIESADTAKAIEEYFNNLGISIDTADVSLEQFLAHVENNKLGNIELPDNFVYGLNELRKMFGYMDDDWRTYMAQQVGFVGNRTVTAFNTQQINSFSSLYDAIDQTSKAYEDNTKALQKYRSLMANTNDKEAIDIYNKEIAVLEERTRQQEAFLTKFGWTGTDDALKKRQSLLKDELSTVEKIYKEYQSLRKYMSVSDAQATINQMFGNVPFKILGMATSFEEMREQLNKALKEAKRLGDTKLVMDIEYTLGKLDADESKQKMEHDMRKLSDELSRTKTAKEFFDRMLGMTGDKELSASLTVSIYGGEMGDDLGERLAKDMATKFQEQVQKYFGDIDISSAINKATGEIDPIKLEKLLTEENIEKIGKDNVIEIRKIINDLIKANADYATELFKSYEKFFDYEKRMTMVTQREEEERKKIRESMIPDDQKVQLEEASKKREQEQISAIEIEQLKDTADWEKTFEDLNNLGSLTVKNLISLLEDYIAKKKEAGEPIAESDMKTLMNELNQLRERDAQLDPFATIKVSLKDLTDATKEYNKAKKDGDEKGMADAQNKRAKALNKLETAVNAVASGFQNLSNLLTEFQELLGIEDDSAMGEVFNGASKALGFVATALSTAIALTLLWNSTLWANPLFAGVAIVSGVLGAIAGVFSAIANAKVNKANEEIERQQELLDNLSYSYDQLQKSAEKAFGTEYIQNYQRQLANLEAQVEAYEKQLSLERSKGKKADEEKIKDYQNQIRDTKDAIEDMYGSLSEHFLGTDLTSAARDFASAWIEAYKSFSNTTDAMKEKFQEMIQNMIVESLIAKVMERALKPVFDMVDNMGDSDFYSNSFWSQLMTEMNKATENGVVGAERIMQMFEQMGINLRDAGTGLTGISRDIATASEESILGLAAGINTQNFYISQVPTKLDTIIGLLRGGSAVVDSGVNVQDLITIQNQFLSHLPTIAQHTAETVTECKAIVVETRRTADALERVIKPDGTRTTYKMNVVTSYQG